MKVKSHRDAFPEEAVVAAQQQPVPKLDSALTPCNAAGAGQVAEITTGF